MKHIGIVAGADRLRASKLKAEILARDPSAQVWLDTEEWTNTDAQFQKSDEKIISFDAVERLAALGAQVVAFTSAHAHDFLSELQAETVLRLISPCDAAGQMLALDAYAERLVAEPEALLPRPFKVGVLGGLGPAATVDLYDKIVRTWPAKNDQEHFKLVVEQNPQTPDRTKALLEGGADPTLALYHSAKRMQADGCDCLAIACNTAHAFVPAIERHLKIDFINMQQVTLEEIQERFGESARIGLMATTGTVQTGIYGQKAKEMGLPMFVPDAAAQNKVMAAIYGPQGAKAGFTQGQCWDDLMTAAQYLVTEYECNVLILGCTELPLIFQEGHTRIADRDVYIIDPTAAVARRVAKVAQKTIAERGVI